MSFEVFLSSPKKSGNTTKKSTRNATNVVLEFARFSNTLERIIIILNRKFLRSATLIFFSQSWFNTYITSIRISFAPFYTIIFSSWNKLNTARTQTTRYKSTPSNNAFYIYDVTTLFSFTILKFCYTFWYRTFAMCLKSFFTQTFRLFSSLILRFDEKLLRKTGSLSSIFWWSTTLNKGLSPVISSWTENIYKLTSFIRNIWVLFSR